MLVQGSRFIQLPIMSLQTGSKIGHTIRPVIEPRTLTIEAFEIETSLRQDKPLYLLIDDIREYGRMGFIINSIDELVLSSDVVRLEELLEDNFTLNHLMVEDELGKRLGKVSGYTVESNSFVIQQLQVRRGFLQGINDTGFLINRKQVVEITHKKIIVKSTLKNIKQEKDVAPLEYVNPFRQAPQPEQPQS